MTGFYIFLGITVGVFLIRTIIVIYAKDKFKLKNGLTYYKRIFSDAKKGFNKYVLKSRNKKSMKH